MSWFSKFVNDISGKSARRAAERVAQAQIDAINQETDAVTRNRVEIEAQKDRERKKIEGKQIRALRRSRRTSSFDVPSDEPKSTLG